MLKFALVGCGGMANYHAKQLQRIESCKVVALCDIVPEKTKEYRTKYFADAKEYDDFFAMINKEKLDGVVLVTPHSVHYPHAKAALEKGINVLCEKPLVTSSEHAYDLWKTVKRTKKLLAIAFQSSYSSEFGYLAQERDAGRLGKVQLISGYLSQGWRDATIGLWRQDPAIAGGGQMYDSGAHMLNAFMWLMNSPVIEVACFYDKAGTPVDINGVAIVKFQNGAMGSICIGGNCPPFRTNIQIQTDKYLIITDQYGSKLEMYGASGRQTYPHVDLDQRPSGGTSHLNFVNAILGKEKLRAPVRYGVLMSALMDALYESADKQRPVMVKPVPEDI